MPTVENPRDIVPFGQKLSSRQHAFEAMLHYGLPEADARREAASLPTLVAAATFEKGTKDHTADRPEVAEGEAKPADAAGARP
jgi:hypothetical protein